MTHQNSTLSPLENMTKAEGVLHGVVRMALIEIILLAPSLSETAIAVLATISIYIALSAVMRWDPFYASIARFSQIHHLSRHPLRRPRSVSTKPDSKRNTKRRPDYPAAFTTPCHTAPSLLNQLIAAAMNRDQIAGIGGIGLNLLAQAHYKIIHGACRHFPLMPPDLGQ